MQQYEPKIGDFVQSKYRAQWHGIILDSAMCSGSRPRLLVAVLPLFTWDGRPQRKPKVRIMHISWFHESTLKMSESYLSQMRTKISQKGYMQKVKDKLQQWCR